MHRRKLTECIGGWGSTFPPTSRSPIFINCLDLAVDPEAGLGRRADQSYPKPDRVRLLVFANGKYGSPHMRRSVLGVSSSGSNLIIGLFAQPGLEHQHVPQEVLMVSASGKMLVPELPYRIKVKVSLAPWAGFAQQIFRPITKRTVQPNAE